MGKKLAQRGCEWCGKGTTRYIEWFDWQEGERIICIRYECVDCANEMPPHEFTSEENEQENPIVTAGNPEAYNGDTQP